MKNLFESVELTNTYGEEVRMIGCNYNLIDDDYSKSLIHGFGNIVNNVKNLNIFADEMGGVFITEFVQNVLFKDSENLWVSFNEELKDLNVDLELIPIIDRLSIDNSVDYKLNKICRKLLLAILCLKSNYDVKNVLVKEIEKEFDMTCIKFFNEIIKINSSIFTLNNDMDDAIEILTGDSMGLSVKNLSKYLRVRIDGRRKFKRLVINNVKDDEDNKIKIELDHNNPVDVAYRHYNITNTMGYIQRKTPGELKILRNNIFSEFNEDKQEIDKVKIFFDYYKSSSIFRFFKSKEHKDELGKENILMINSTIGIVYLLFNEIKYSELRKSIIDRILPEIIGVSNEDICKEIVNDKYTLTENDITIITRLFMLQSNWIMEYYINHNFK